MWTDSMLTVLFSVFLGVSVFGWLLSACCNKNSYVEMKNHIYLFFFVSCGFPGTY